MRTSNCFLAAITLLATWSSEAKASLELDYQLKGMVQLGVYHNDNDYFVKTPWYDGGVGIHRYDDQTTLQLDQLLVDLDVDLTESLTLTSAFNYNADGESGVGATEFFIHYRPLNKSIKHELKFGMYYPSFSFENPDIGWSSPYSNSFSAINSWVAEELRPIGVEWQAKRVGAKFKSPHSYTLVLSAYQHNDGLGSLLSWRGWALHNRQSSHHEKVHFANYFKFMPVENPNPTYVDINDETDGRVGYYVGGHWQYKRQSEARLYFYDNMANPFSIESDMQYGWRTRFWSLAAQHKFNNSFRLLGQYMVGETEMGNLTKGVLNDFNSWHLIGSYRRDNSRFSIRYDRFEVTDLDKNAFDPNESQGDSLSLNWRYLYSKNIRLGLEALFTTSNNKNRELWPGWQSEQSQNQYSLTVQYRFEK